MLFFKNKIRLRFAPSPTGFLHIGNLRSALFGYLLAKNMGGKFILRIEDTDQKREVPGAVDRLLKIMEWVGIEFDEGPNIGGKSGPYIQTERLNLYKKLSDKLLKEGEAYRCFCSEERLTAMRSEQEAKKKAPRYDGLCRKLSREESDRRAQAGEPFVIRQAIPEEGEIIVHDELRGDIKFKLSDLDDHILIKSNGVPTYQFANIVDDHLMKISHVTRGDEWLPSFPKNILLYQSFGWTPPKFIHLPLILNKEGGKLSKRQGDVFVEQYRDKGYLPEAIINFCVLLGWHPKNDQEIWTLKELKKEFSLKGMGTSPAIFDSEKLDYYNGYYIRQKSPQELTELCRPYLDQSTQNHDNHPLEKYFALAQDRLKKLSDITEFTDFLFALPEYSPELLCWKTLTLQDSQKNLLMIKKELEKIDNENWNKDTLEKTAMDWIKEQGGKNGDYLWPLRVSLTGLKNSPSPFEVADALGKTESLKRIEKALN
ncbi:MAG: glutamate--tRNA ligase [Patescibacteria group bacterium]